MKYVDYYAALGVPRDADQDTIKKAYRSLARKFHPDVSKAADAETRFKQVGEAYATLKDPEKRAAYDDLGRQPEGSQFEPPPQWRSAHGAQGNSFDDFDLADLLAALGRRHQSDPNASGPRTQRPRQGQDHEHSLTITLEQAHRGASLTLDLADDTGTHTLEVKIPAGVSEASTLRLRGKGGKGRNGGPDGDLYLHIHLAPHASFRTDGHDLLFDLLLTPWEAALGADVEVDTLDGPVTLSVAPGTQSGRKLRLRGRGLANGQGGAGDLYALVRIAVPTSLTERERKLFKELAECSPFAPRKKTVKETADDSRAV